MKYPDKPAHTVGRAALCAFTNHLCQLKIDGWRCVVEIGDGEVWFTSSSGMSLPVTLPMIRDDLLEICAPGTILDAEWVKRRPSHSAEALWFFDVMQIGSDKLWGHAVENRFKALHALLPLERFSLVPTVWATPEQGEAAAEFFEDHMDTPWAEGVVLKELGSTYIGSVRQCFKNQAWTRCKWRAGEDGMTKVT